MNKVVTSREEILEKSREIVLQYGLNALNIREVAKLCNVSIGSIYNYFQSKSELSAATVESIWTSVFHGSRRENFTSTVSCIEWIFDSLKKGAEEYPGFFTMHTGLQGDGNITGKDMMKKSWSHIQKGICEVIRNDKSIRADAFNEDFTPEKFCEVVFALIISAMQNQDFDSYMAVEITKRCLV